MYTYNTMLPSTSSHKINNNKNKLIVSQLYFKSINYANLALKMYFRVSKIYLLFFHVMYVCTGSNKPAGTHDQRPGQLCETRGSHRLGPHHDPAE